MTQPGLFPEPPPTAPQRRACEWCGKPGATLYEVEPAQFGSERGQRILRKQPVKAYACDPCAKRFDTQKAQREAEREAKRRA